MLLAITAIAVIVGTAMFPLMLDDAYITYTAARNFARSGMLLHSTASPYLTTTAPLYGILLGVGSRLGFDIPTLSRVLSVGGIWGTAMLLYWLCRRRGQPLAGVVAALFVATSPLLWLFLGLETTFAVMLIVAMFFLYDRESYVAAAAVGALATMTRPGSIVAVGILVVYHLFVARRRLLWLPVVVYLALLLPVVAYLTASVGSPLPVTLQAKQAQRQLGITGFFVGTTYLQGLMIMARGWLSQTAFYVLALLLVGLGALALPRQHWAWGIVAWGVFHMIGYIVLRVVPYAWYYAPLVPASALLVGLGAAWLAARFRRSWAKALAWALPAACLLVAHGVSLHRMQLFLDGSITPLSDYEAKVLPGDSGRIYTEVGKWLNENTPKDATVAVTEVGIMGFFADRRMIDFLGVLQPDVAEALAREDLYYTIPRYMPDYVVLGPDLGTFGTWFGDDAWFLANYQPVHEIYDDRFWSGSLVILKRIRQPGALVEHAADLWLTDGVLLKSYAVAEEKLKPGSGARIRFDWVASEGLPPELKTVAYLKDAQSEVVASAERDSPLFLWRLGQVTPVYYTLYLDKALTPGAHTLNVRLIVNGRSDVYQALVPVEIREP